MIEPLLDKPVVKFNNEIALFRLVPVLENCLQVSVIVPVRNEAAHLVETLEALRNQVDKNGKPLPTGTYEVLLLANNCTDNSARIAIDYQTKFPSFPLQVTSINLPPAKANIGTVRRMLMDEAFRHLKESGNPNGIIASTDGDTVVDSRWIANILHEIAMGNDAVGGRILTTSDKSPARLFHLRDVRYRTLLAQAESILDPVVHDPWPRHFQYFGASLAVTCKAYERAGRLPQVPYLEDNAFYTALMGIDAKVRKSNAVKVFTSTRTAGRVEIGFSEQLKKWNSLATTSAVQLAEPAEAMLIKFKNRFELRNCRNVFLQTGRCPKEIITIATALFINPLWLKAQLQSSRYFGELWQQIEQEMNDGKWNHFWKPVPITESIAALRLFISKEAAGHSSSDCG